MIGFVFAETAAAAAGSLWRGREAGKAARNGPEGAHIKSFLSSI